MSAYVDGVPIAIAYKQLLDVISEQKESLIVVAEEKVYYRDKNRKLTEALRKIERGVMCYTNLEIRSMVKEALKI